MFNINNVSERIINLLEENEEPKQELPPTGIKCIAMRRRGLSAYRTAAKIIEGNQKLGIPTGPNEDGSPNLINQYTYNLVKEIFNALQNEAVITASIPKATLLVETTGANGGGPVICTGTNLTDTNSRGIIQ